MFVVVIESLFTKDELNRCGNFFWWVLLPLSFSASWLRHHQHLVESR